MVADVRVVTIRSRDLPGVLMGEVLVRFPSFEPSIERECYGRRMRGRQFDERLVFAMLGIWDAVWGKSYGGMG
jgi:hypothetical protein